MMFHRGIVVALLGCGAGLACAACGGGGSAGRADAAAGSDVRGPDVASACEGVACDLTCDSSETWLALTRGPGTGLGDADPAGPEEVGDGSWHLFVGVNEPTTALPDVYVYDATAARPDGMFALPASPLGRARDGYDQLGSETPSYLRADAHREYVYYCGIQSYSPLSAHLAAYRRVDGGAWTKVGIVAPNATDELTLCEPNVVRDDATGALVLRYLSVTSGNRVQERQRTSTDPEAFATTTMTTTLDSALDAAFPNRLALSRDPYAGVWRTAYDLSLGNYATMTLQTWSVGPSTSTADLARARTLHDGAHALHAQLHTDFSSCDMTACPQGAVLQPSRAIYPSPTEVIFYYSGWNTSPPAASLQVNGQRCRRR